MAKVEWPVVKTRHIITQDSEATMQLLSTVYLPHTDSGYIDKEVLYKCVAYGHLAQQPPLLCGVMTQLAAAVCTGGGLSHSDKTKQ